MSLKWNWMGGVTSGVIGLLVLAAAACSAQVTFTEFPVPTSDSGPNFIVAGPDGNLWFTEFRGNKIARITPAGVISEFPLAPNPASPEFGSNVPNGITMGPDGNLWFTELFGNKIGRITTAGAITEFPVPNGGASPYGITSGPDGNLWFTEENGNRIGRITPGGTITEFSLPGGGTPLGIAAGADGNLWFTEQGGNKIGRITTAGAIVEFPVPSPNTAPFGISAGPDGNLWFTEETGNRIGRITPGGTITEFPLPNGGTPIGITLGPDRNLWFTEESRDTIARITPGGVITEFAAAGGSVEQLATGPDGNIWFTDQVGNRIGKAQVPLLPTCTTAVAISLLLPGHGGNAGQVTTQIYGCAFNPAAQVRLTGLGADITGGNTMVTGATALTTTFDLTGAAAGVRNVVITNPDGTTATLTGGFTVEQGGAPQIWVDIIGRNVIRIGTAQTYYLECGNRGNVDAALVQCWVSFPASVQWSSSSPDNTSLSSTINTSGNVVLAFDVIAVGAGGSTVIPLNLTTNTSDPLRLSVWSNMQ
ncbi:MAG TPA: hypothetical protein VKU19_25265 [Bryobacteraceae bacterium]|nr:hypothetical protein [Bryobacteraceae bacterium]